MTKRGIGSVFFGIWLGCFTATATQLPPDVMVDKYLLQAKMLSEEKDHKGALEAMDRIVALGKEHQLTLPEAFPFQYAQTALAAGSVQAAIESVNRYLSVAGRNGKFYRQALELLVKAERRLPEPTVDRAESRGAEPDIGRQRQVVPPSPPVADGTTEVRPEPDCGQWNTRKYFQVATVEGVTACLATGADPLGRDDHKNTPLHDAARHNANPAVIEVLLAAGAKLKARDGFKSTPLHQAAGHNANPAVIEALIKAGADPVARDKWKDTPLHDAARYNANPAVIEVLLAAGAKLKARDDNKNTPLHQAVRHNENPAVIEALIKAGADLDARDKWKLTPLHFAARYNANPAVIKDLLRAGADVKARDEDGRTPLSLANEHNENPAVRQVLLAAGAGRVERQIAAAKAQRESQSDGGGALAALVAGVAGGAIASASGLDAATATEIGATIGGSVLAGEAVGSSGTGAASDGTYGNPGGSSGDLGEALGNLENSCGERFRSAFSEQNHGRFYCLDAFARHCALKKGHNQQQLDALRHDFEVLRSQGQESGCPYFGVFGVTYAPGFEREAIDRAEKETKKAQEERQRRLDEQARQDAQKGKRRVEENNARVLASDCDCISKDERDGKLTCLDGFVGLTESLCNVRFRRR